MHTDYYIISNALITKIIKNITNNYGTSFELQSSKDVKFKYYENSDKCDIEYHNRNGQLFAITIPYKSEISNFNICKIFNFLLSRSNSKDRETIEFALEELVNDGIYKNIDSARKGLLTSFKKISDVKIRTDEEPQDSVFSDLQIKNGICSIKDNLESFVTFEQYTIIPVWANKLSNNAYQIVDFFYYLARQNTIEILNSGQFNIKMSSINAHIGGPSRQDTARQKALIMLPIIDALNEIKYKQIGDDLEFTTPHKNQSCYEFLKSIMTIKFNGYSREFFEKIGQKKNQSKRKRQKAA